MGRSRHAARRRRTGTVVAGLLTVALAGGLAIAGRAVFGIAAAAPGQHAVRSLANDKPARSQPGHSAQPDHSAQPGPARHPEPLAGLVVGIDPGHNGLNYTDPAFLTQQIFNGRSMENCNTTGTQTAGGYTEAQFNFNVAMYLVADLRGQGARIVLTRHDNHGIGPCVNNRAAIIDKAHASVAIDIHADGGPAWGRGFTVLEPVADGPNNKVIASSVRFGSYVHQAFLAQTALRPSDYYGSNGYIFRNDLAGLNLTTVPEVLIECGNMPNAADAAILTSPAGQRQIAAALDAAIVRFLTGRWPGAAANAG